MPSIRMSKRRAAFGASALVAIIAAVITVTIVQDSDAGASAVKTEDATMTFPESPGSSDTVDIDTRLYLPSTGSPAPAVLLAHGFGGDKNSVDGQARTLAERGFVVLAYTARGFGNSTGKISLDDPDREVADARGLVDYLATRSEVEQDGPGDPHVGVAGGSYGGALALMLAGTDNRIDADAAAITWNDLGQSLFPNYAVPVDGSSRGATPAATVVGQTGVLKRGWAGVFFGAGAAPTGNSADAPTTDAPTRSGSGEAAGPCGRFAEQFCQLYLQSAVTGVPTPDISALLTAHSPTAFASSITAPTLLVQGQQDTLFGLDQADATARQIAAAGGSVQVRWFDGGHDAGGTNAASDAAISDFLVEHLMDGASPSGSRADSPFRFTLSGDAADQGRRTQTMTATDYPGLATSDAVPTQQFSLSPADPAQSQIIIRPPGASPSAISSIPGLTSALSVLGSTGAAGALIGDLPGQTATFTTEPLSSSVTITGSSTVDLTVGAFAGQQQSVLFAKLYDVAPDGRRTLPDGVISAIRLPDNTSGATNVRVSLPGIGYLVAEGHRLEVTVATTDQAYAVPLEPAQFSVALTDGALTVPTVQASEAGSSTVPIAPLIGIAALAALIAAVVIVSTVLGRRRTVAEVDSTLVDTPLVITNLEKTYSNGFKAVNGVSFTVERGQVLGLLGPNGAGKTTTLRMLMGLMTPSSGTIRVFGHQVTPGSPVLSRLGSFIEGSGFLPHLSGTDNLKLYWEATGRPLADAHLEEALEIADLGTAVERKVRSYSQGMRQRLAIAQAMLGLPDLMVLDEPTNGLDPPQIRTMRDVLISYANTGRTVLVSSHLLAEVEQTCTHVVVMNRGSVISTGTVQELIGGAGPTDFRLEPAARGMELISAMDGVEDVRSVTGDDSAVRADLGSVDTAAVVRSLVGGGVDVLSVSRATRLEDVFLELVHDDAVPDTASTPEGSSI